MSAAPGDCIFCKIVAGDIPAKVIYQDDAGVAFLDVGPLADGHTLLIPQKHYSTIDEMPADEFASLMTALPRLARAVREVSGATGINVLQNNGADAGQVVEHVHIHIIPRRAGDGLGFRWNAGKYAAGRAEALQAALQRLMGRSD